MKECKLTFQRMSPLKGNRYIIQSNGMVARISNQIVEFCGSAESAVVIQEAKRLRLNKNRRARHQAMKDLGLKRAISSSGGVYYE